MTALDSKCPTCDAANDAAPITQEVLEALAALCHDMWSGWMRYQFDKLILDATSKRWVMGLSDEERWRRQMHTPYADLSENEKESDRKEADRIIELLSGKVLES